MILASFLAAIPLHEFAHAQMAVWLGDPTPRSEGRYTLNLRSHIDALGTLLCIILAFLPVTAGPVGLGWGRPVKIDPWKLRGGRNAGPIMVALAGPLFSLLLGLLFILLTRLTLPFLEENGLLVRIPQLLLVFGVVNVSLAIFNALPIYPLDGYEIVYMLLPTREALQFARSAPWGPFIILLLFFVLPFLAQFSGLGGLPFFHIPFYILLGSLNIASLVMGQPLTTVTALYTF